MNKEQRKVLAGLAADLDEARGKVEDIKAQIETLRDEEQEKYDNMPENLQGGERGEKLDQAITELQDAIDNIERMDFDWVIEALGRAEE